MKLHTGDQVVVISGKDKGKTGTVLRVLPNTGRVVVSDINMRTKHVKKMPNRAGQIVHYEASINASNVMLIDAKTKKRTRIGYEVTEKGKKRIARKSGEEVKKAKVKKAVEDKEAGEAKEDKKAKAKTKAKAKDESADSGSKTPFWKKVGFGADAMDDAEVKDSGVSNAKQSDQGKTPDNFNHERGS